jgi:hypothetical protein
MTDVTIREDTRAGDPIAFAGTKAVRTREQRGLRYFGERGHEIQRAGEGVFWVPSRGGNRTYTVRYPADEGGQESCSCPDASYGDSTCLHLYAVAIKVAKDRERSRKNFIHSVVWGEEEE